MMIKTLTFLSLTVIAIYSCKKSGSDGSNTARTMQTISGNYKITGILSQFNNSAPIDYYATMLPACEKDDIHHLQLNGSYTLTDAGVVCTPPNGPVSSAWSVANDSVYFGPLAHKIDNFDGTTLVITEKSYVGGGYLSYTYTYKRQ
jgi:hypothetical protein